MSTSFGSLAFTPEVQTLQERFGSRQQYARMQERMERSGTGPQPLGDFEREFIAERDSFYWATVGSTGWPYVQHRGGPSGFLKVIDDHTLALADLRGNKQYISAGNLQTDARVAIILMDYGRQERMKILGTVEVLEGDAAVPWLDRVRMAEEKSPIERVFLIHIEAFDWNCPQHITPRFTGEQVRAAIEPLEQKLRTLEAENKRLRALAGVA
jgi:predicted pyridoxine 5'-phosphate oxidase superfamily flavin-nucleotide-binding protein